MLELTLLILFMESACTVGWVIEGGVHDDASGLVCDFLIISRFSLDVFQK